MKGKTITRTAAIVMIAVVLLYAASISLAKFGSETPEQLIAKLQQSASKGDVEGVLSGLTAESRKAVEKSYADREPLDQSREEFRKALNEHFGEGQAFLPVKEDDLKATIGRLLSTEVVSQKEYADGSVEVQVKTSIKGDGDKSKTVESTLLVRKEEGEWRLALGLSPNRSDADRIKAAIQVATKDVRDGKYQDRFTAMVALDNALNQAEGGN